MPMPRIAPSSGSSMSATQPSASNSGSESASSGDRIFWMQTPASAPARVHSSAVNFFTTGAIGSQ